MAGVPSRIRDYDWTMPGSADVAAAPSQQLDRQATASGGRHECCSLYHRAVELVGKRWTGAILIVMMDGPLRFSEIKQLVPDLSDRLLSERLKELEAEGIVERSVACGTPVRVEYSLTDKGRALEPTVRALKRWAHAWL
jgi:DNA-binding HxlR family transcriptional regulator